MSQLTAGFKKKAIMVILPLTSGWLVGGIAGTLRGFVSFISELMIGV